MKKETLELKHLVPYLPYGIKIFDGKMLRKVVIDHATYDLSTIGIARLFKPAYDFSMGLPVLRPLSDLTKEIEHNGKKIIFHKELKLKEDQFSIETENNEFIMYMSTHSNYNSMIPLSLQAYMKLFEYLFDVNGLIEKELAININSLNLLTYEPLNF